jgi:hypothetical protein
VHEVQDGTYALTATQSVRDDCALENAPGVIASGVLRTTGDVVRIEYDFFSIQLDGAYQSQTEHMSLDGSATNVELDVQNVQCLLDLVTMHIDATAVDSKTFSGSIAFSLQTRRPESCNCELWLEYTAHQTQAAP